MDFAWREESEFDSAKGRLRIFARCAPGYISRLSLDEGIGVFPSYRSLVPTIEGLVKFASGSDNQVALAVDGRDRIVGFSVIRMPEEERWHRVGPGRMRELFAELSRPYRAGGLARRLLGTSVFDPVHESNIVYIMAYSWHWDLEGSKRTIHEYRAAIMSILKPMGFRQYPTNEPNICLRPENLFMARMGSKVDEGLTGAFKAALFDIQPV